MSAIPVRHNSASFPRALLGVAVFGLVALAIAPTASWGADDNSDRVPSENAGETTSEDILRVGFDGIYKVGHWTPVSVIADAASEVSVVVPDGDGVMCRFPLKRSKSSAETFQGYARIGQSRSALQVSVDGQIQELPLPTESEVRGTQRLVLVIGADIGIAKALRLRNFTPDTTVKTTRVVASELPDSWYGYDGVDLVVLTTGGDEKDLVDLESNGQRWKALAEWVQMGGRLIISIGKNGERLLAPGQPFTELIPGEFRGVSNQRDTSELETFVGASERLDMKWRNLPRAEQGVPMTQLANVRGLVVVAEGVGTSSTPWAIRAAHGFGSITFLACDLDSGPIADWESRTRFLANLLDASLMHRSLADNDNSRGQLSHLGFSDLSGQLRAALEQYEGVHLIPFSLIAAFAIAYVLWVGPLDYFLLKKLAPRMEWTWLTFPLIILTTTAVAVGLARSWKGSVPSRNVVDLIDVDTEHGRVRCTSWAHHYYPHGGHYDFSVEPDASLRSITSNADVQTLVSWQGLPGAAFGGMQNRATATDVMAPYTNQLSQVHGLPIPNWSSRSLTATWWGQSPVVSSSLKLDRDEVLGGSIENPLPVTIRDAVICYGRSYYEVGTLGPGATFPLGGMAQPRDFRYRLTRRKIVDDREIMSPWDKENLNVPRIMEMIMFHDKAGGHAYTDLWSRYHHELDMSDHLSTGSAVLYGRSSTAATHWSNRTPESKTPSNAPPEIDDSKTKNWTFCRILYPVERNAQSRYRPDDSRTTR